MGFYGKKIVAVDDSVIILKMLGKVLDKKCELHAFSDGNRALEFLRKKTADLIILDIEMPGISGFDMLTKIKQIDHLKYVPIFFLTSNSEKSNVVKAIAGGADDYVVKPIDEDILLQKIEKLFW